MRTLGRIGYTLLAVGVAIALAGFVMGGRAQVDIMWNKFAPRIVTKSIATTTQPTAGRTDDTAAVSGDIKNLDFSIGGAKVTIKTGDTFSIQTTGDPNYSDYYDNDTYHIKTDSEWNLLRNAKSNVSFTITVPDYEYNNVNLEIGAGTMSADGISCKTANISTGAGKMDITNFKCTEESSINVGMGTFEYSGTLLGANAIKCGMGTIKLSVDAPEDYGYSISCGMGSVSIGSAKYSGISDVSKNTSNSTVYNIDCGMGTVDMKFV